MTDPLGLHGRSPRAEHAEGRRAHLDASRLDNLIDDALEGRRPSTDSTPRRLRPLATVIEALVNRGGR